MLEMVLQQHPGLPSFIRTPCLSEVTSSPQQPRGFMKRQAKTIALSFATNAGFTVATCRRRIRAAHPGINVLLRRTPSVAHVCVAPTWMTYRRALGLVRQVRPGLRRPNCDVPSRGCAVARPRLCHANCSRASSRWWIKAAQALERCRLQVRRQAALPGVAPSRHIQRHVALRHE